MRDVTIDFVRLLNKEGDSGGLEPYDFYVLGMWTKSGEMMSSSYKSGRLDLMEGRWRGTLLGLR